MDNSSQNKTTLRARRGLEFIPMQHGEQRFVLIQDHLGLVQEGLGIALPLYQLIALLDGTRTVGDLQAELARHQGGVLVSGQESLAPEERFNVCGFPAMAALLEILPPCLGQIIDYRLHHEQQTRSAVSFAVVVFSDFN